MGKAPAKLARVFSLFILVLFSALALSTDSQRPKFSDFPVEHVYQGRPTPPVLNTKYYRTYRTAIREGAKSNVEFAGHYTVPRWGCGMGCTLFVVVDSRTGKVYDFPATVVDLPGEWVEKNMGDSYRRMEFHPNSRLMKPNSCPGERDCGLYDYVMVEGKGLKLVRKELLPKKYQ